MVAYNIIEREEVPFLHVKPTNDIAIKLYEKLGFRIRTEVEVAMIKSEA
jgi:predicted GNAT family acetyltransferase